MNIFNRERLLQAAQAANDRSAGDDRPIVLVVDDEPGNLTVMATILGPHYRVLQAGGGEEALALVGALDDRAGVACVVTDQRMPGLTGVELLDRLRPALPLASRIIVTAYADVNVIVDAINKAEIYRFIVKPFDAEDFLLTVRRAVEAMLLKQAVQRHTAELEQRVEERTLQLREKNELLEHEIAAHRAAEEEIARERAFSLSMVKLSERERECLNWCAAGKTAWETGQILGLSEWTVVYHLERIKRKLGLSTKQQMVARAVSLGLVDTPVPPAEPGERLAAAE